MGFRITDRPLLLTLVAAVTLTTPLRAQLVERMRWGADLETRFSVTPDIVYETANNYQARLDVYRPQGTDGPAPTLVYIHGGG